MLPLLARMDRLLLDRPVWRRAGLVDGGLETRPVGLALEDEVVRCVLEAVDGVSPEPVTSTSTRTSTTTTTATRALARSPSHTRIRTGTRRSCTTTRTCRTCTTGTATERSSIAGSTMEADATSSSRAWLLRAPVGYASANARRPAPLAAAPISRAAS